MNLFKDKSMMPEKAAQDSLSGSPISPATPEPSLVVRTAQTMREVTSCQRVYCRDENDVRNITRPRFGHGY